MARARISFYFCVDRPTFFLADPVKASKAPKLQSSKPRSGPSNWEKEGISLLIRLPSSTLTSFLKLLMHHPILHQPVIVKPYLHYLHTLNHSSAN